MTAHRNPSEAIDPNQGVLLGVETSHYGDVASTALVPVDFSETPSVPLQTETIYHVDTRVRARMLLESLGHLASAAGYTGFVKAQHTSAQTEIAKRYQPSELSSRIDHAKSSKHTQFASAKSHFLHAYNLGREQPVTDDDVEFKDAFSQFNFLYGIGGLPQDSEQRSKRRDELRANLEKIRKIPGPAQQLAEVAVEQSVVRPGPTEVPELPQLLGLRSRLGVLMDEADGAKFAPATRDEITDALPLLDSGEEGNPHNHLEYTRRRVQNQLRAKGSPSVVAEWHGQRAVVSRIYEFGDYLSNARASIEALAALEQEIAGMNPRLSLETVVASNQPGVPVLVRHIVANLLAKGKMSADEFDFRPMTSREERRSSVPDLPPQTDAKTLAQARAGIYSNENLELRHKILHDPFTDPQRSPEVEAYIAEAIREITVKDAVKLLPFAINSQQNREAYWTRMLHGVRGRFRYIAESQLHQSNQHIA